MTNPKKIWTTRKEQRISQRTVISLHDHPNKYELWTRERRLFILTVLIFINLFAQCCFIASAFLRQKFGCFQKISIDEILSSTPVYNIANRTFLVNGRLKQMSYDDCTNLNGCQLRTKIIKCFFFQYSNMHAKKRQTLQFFFSFWNVQPCTLGQEVGTPKV